MATFTQQNRPLRVSTALGTDVLLLQGVTGDEGVSTPFSFTLDLWSTNTAIDANALLNTPACVTITHPGGERLIHGRISRFAQMGRDRELTGYRATLVPWTWLLSLSSDCKIFQKKTVLEIVEDVFRDLGFSDFKMQCQRQYKPREFCVQYRETHLNFISRLLEEEGIFYYFTHESAKHTMVLADDASTIPPCPVQPDARIDANPGASLTDDIVTSMHIEHGVYTGKVTLRDHDYLQPALRLETTVAGRGVGELYDYPGNYAETPGDSGISQKLERTARLLLEEREAARHTVRGDSSCRMFHSGHSFNLKNHYRADANQAYRLLQVQHAAYVPDYQSGDGAGIDYRNSFVAVAKSVPFRPPRLTPKPLVAGSQTAVVVGKSGEEIWVDSHGRVKVQFHWDRNGRRDENSSCPVRVSAAWAGKGWGAIQIPRIGQEVIVDFLEGDPDKPIITGRVYNADQTPPYPLPGEQTRSGVKSRSTKTGSTDNFNEIRMEDKKGDEQIFIHAEKDLKTEVENDEFRDVLHDRTTVIKNHDKRTVKEGDDTEVIEKGNQTTSIKMGDQKVTLDQGNQAITLNKGNQETAVKMGNQTTDVKMGNITAKASLGKVTFEAMQSIEFKVGQSSVKIDQMGVTIKGMNVSMQGQIQAEVKGVLTTVKGDGMLTVKGGITMIN